MTDRDNLQFLSELLLNLGAGILTSVVIYVLTRTPLEEGSAVALFILAMAAFVFAHIFRERSKAS